MNASTSPHVSLNNPFQLMGITNVTPDSFSDGGQYFDETSAVQRGLTLQRQGASIIDIGGQSTRPFAEPVSIVEEKQRVLPVLNALNDDTLFNSFVSIDTMHAETAAVALDHGADMINDVSGLTIEHDMIELIKNSGAHYVLTHNRGTPQTMTSLTSYPQGVLAGVIEELDSVLSQLKAKKIPAEQIIVDPGFGFSKTSEQSWELLGGLPEFVHYFKTHGYHTLVAASRKRFLTDQYNAIEPVLEHKDTSTALITQKALEAKAWGVRVHNVPASYATVEFFHKFSAL